MPKSIVTKKILKRFQIEALNKMQVSAFNAISKPSDVVLLAPTGSGKTLAFLLPLLKKMNRKVEGIQCLILTPSRELALQIESVWKKMKTGFKVTTCYGGHSMQDEKNSLKTPPGLLIGTPGRIEDHIHRKTFSTKMIPYLILDEFDKSLELGFQNEMSYIIGKLFNLKQRILVSATSGIEIPSFTRVEKPLVINFSKVKAEYKTLELKLVESPIKDKVQSLFEVLCYIKSDSTLIFVNHRQATERIVAALKSKKVEAHAFHGGMDQDEREKVLLKFRNNTIQFLVATDLAGRGLDIPQVKHVIHYHFPLKEDIYTHRNGRTARQQAEGTAYVIQFVDEELPSYLSPNDFNKLKLEEPFYPPKPSPWTTLFINGGKKTKLSKIDIVGFLSKKGELERGDLGLIEVKAKMSFVAVKTSKVKNLLKKVAKEKMKGKNYRISIAK